MLSPSSLSFSKLPGVLLWSFKCSFLMVIFFFAISCICFQLPVLIFYFLLLRPYLPSPSCLFHLFYIFYSCLSTPLPPPLPGRSGLAASYLSVKALVPQMPKLLKSLFPARDDKKELRPSPNSQQVRRGGSKIHTFLPFFPKQNFVYLWHEAQVICFNHVCCTAECSSYPDIGRRG